MREPMPDSAKYQHAREMTRRQFGAVSAGAGLAMLLPRPANAQDVTESENRRHDA